jgi:hypothetical protein
MADVLREEEQFFDEITEQSFEDCSAVPVHLIGLF